MAAGDAEHEEDIFEEFQSVSTLLLKFFSSPHSSLRTVASSCFLCVARAIFHGRAMACDVFVSECVCVCVCMYVCVCVYVCVYVCVCM